MVTPDQVELVQSSFAAVIEGGEADAMASAFYDRLFERDPDSRALFTTEPAAQRAKFVDELQAIVWAVSNLDQFLERTRALGERHLGYGVSARHYTPVGEALMAALGETLGDRFTPAVGEAWALAYNLVAETMMQAAADARRRGTDR